MWQRFTESARSVVMRAAQHASAIDSSTVECEHLLWALMREKDHVVDAVIGGNAVQSPTIEPELMRQAVARAGELNGNLSEPDVQEISAVFRVDAQLVRRIQELILLKLRAQPDKPQAKLSAAAKRVLELAADEARRLHIEVKGSDAIGPEHLLLGLLRNTNTAAAQILNRQGLELVSARTMVAELLNQRGDHDAS